MLVMDKSYLQFGVLDYKLLKFDLKLMLKVSNIDLKSISIDSNLEEKDSLNTAIYRSNPGRGYLDNLPG